MSITCCASRCPISPPLTSFYKKLIGKIALTDVSSSFAMHQIKYTTELPLDFIPVEE